MYTPKAFEVVAREQINAFLAAHSFGLLVTSVNGQTVATHLPWLLDTDAEERGVLLGHLARGNEQWRGETDALAVFSGPHAYISPSFYASPNTVPTWNYAAVHVYGRVRYFDDPSTLRSLLQRMVEKYEQSRAAPWQWDADAEYSARLLGDIVGVQLTIERVEAKWKLSQNHPRARRERVIAGLEQEATPLQLAVAELMRETL